MSPTKQIVADVLLKIDRPKEKVTENKKYFFEKIGTAFVQENRIDIKIYAVPINWNGEIVIFTNKEGINKNGIYT